MMSAQSLDVRTSKIAVLLNTTSGSFTPTVPDALIKILTAAGVEPAELWQVPGRQIDEALDAAEQLGADTLIVFGGDGTIRAAAQQCGEAGQTLIPLPGGTMNMLPRALYGTRGWREALTDTFADPVAQPVHGAQVGGYRFYVAGAFGGASLFAGAREAVRDGDLLAALDHGRTALSQALARELDYRFDEMMMSKAEAVVVLCPLAPPATDLELRLEAAAIDVEGFGDAIRLALMSAFRGWRADQTVTQAQVLSLDLMSSEPIPAILDGERFLLDPSVRITPVREAFFALKPGAKHDALHHLKSPKSF